MSTWLKSQCEGAVCVKWKNIKHHIKAIWGSSLFFGHIRPHISCFYWALGNLKDDCSHPSIQLLTSQRLSSCIVMWRSGTERKKKEAAVSLAERSLLFLTDEKEAQRDSCLCGVFLEMEPHDFRQHEIKSGNIIKHVNCKGNICKA